MARTRRPPLGAPSEHVDDSTVPVVPSPSDPPVSVVDHVTVDSTTAPVVHPHAAPMEHARTGSRPRSTIIDDSTTVPVVSSHVQEPASSPPTAPVSSPSQHVRAASAIPPPVIPSRFIPPVTNGNAPPTHSVIPNTNSGSMQPPPDRPANEDNPYFVGSGDHPGLILVTPPLSDHNFQQWRRDFHLALGAKNKTGFIDGTLSQPDPTSHLFHSWTRCNQMVMSWIIHCVSLDIKSSIMFLDTAHEMWNELTNRFSQGNGPRLFELQESLTDLRQGDESVTAYFTKLRAIWDEINELRPRLPCTCQASADNTKFQNQEKVLRFLTGINESYQAVRDQVLITEPFPSLSKVFSTIIQHERQRKLRVLPNIIAATSSQPINSSRNKKMHPFCTHCQKPGHLKEKCYVLHGFPPGYFDKRKSDSTQRSTSDRGSQVKGQAAHQASASHSVSDKLASLQEMISQLTEQIQHAQQSQATVDVNTPMASNITGHQSESTDWDC
ncbi:hypothetical protein CsatA_028189 [Cannabis sativa]